jgi:phosphotriesterase-related protein
MGSGYYVGQAQTESVLKMKEEELAERIAKDIFDGVGETGVRAGMIGEIGCMVPIEAFEKKSLRAAAIAQQRTGAPLNVHPSHSDGLVLENIKILEAAGADLTRTVVSHIDAWYLFDDIQQKILDKGCYVEYDCFGYEGYYPPYQGRHFNLPTDETRVKEIMKLIKKGYIDNILIASDHCVKHALVSYGGWGYDHILRNVVPLMKINGMNDDQIKKILVDNPKRLLTFIPAK